MKKKIKSVRGRSQESQERHQVPFHPPVVAFRKGSAIRKAFAQWWRPAGGSDLGELLEAISPRASCDGLDDAFVRGYSSGERRWKVTPGREIKVRIVLDYPLSFAAEGVVSVSTKRIGEIFGHAHDMYLGIYKRDDADRRGKPAPRVGVKKFGKLTAKCMNRAPSSLIWGHDMSDLVFEGVRFEFNPEAREALDAFQDARRASIKLMRSRGGRGAMKWPKLKLDVKKHVLGTVTFDIGS
jgi:hypothetical protein